MRTPKSLEALVSEGVIQEVIRPLMSGKEAQVFVVVADDRYCAAKIYKDAQHRSFKNRADYTEGRKVRNSRDQRAMAKRTKYGKGRDEDAWKHTEVEMIYRLRGAGVRVPEPYMYIDGVLLMELVSDAEGNPAPRLGDLEFSREEASAIYHRLIQEAARMLPVGIVHGDLSEFNVLLAADGPVIIDFPQSVNAAGNQNARSLFLRDIKNLHRFLQRWVPGARVVPYGEEMWELYERNELTPETKLTGKVRRSTGPVDTSAVLSLIDDANRDEAARRGAGRSTAGRGGAGHPTAGRGGAAPTPLRRREVVVEKPQVRSRPNGARGNGPSHRDSERRDGPRRGGPPGRKEDASRPKRGDGAVASTYVSPEARKAKLMVLTPRDEAARPKHGEGRSADSAASRSADPSGAKKRRRSRRPRGSNGPGAEGPAKPTDSESSQGSGRQRRGRRQR